MSSRVKGRSTLIWTLLAAAVVVAAAVLFLSPASRGSQDGVDTAPPKVAADFALKSTTVELPSEEPVFPAGPNADTMTAACTACHTPGMILNQPALSREQWEGVIHKMQEVYKAPIAEADVPKILEYLDAMSERQRGAR